jgi:hypothetical protein
MALNSNVVSLKHLGVDVVILLRILSTFLVALGDWLFNERTLPSPNSTTCLVSLLLASFFVFFDAQKFSSVGIFYGVLYMIFIAADQVFLKYFTDKTQISTLERMFWVNLFSIPVAFFAALINEEFYFDFVSIFEVSKLLPVASSCFLAVGISYTAWETRSRVFSLH